MKFSPLDSVIGPSDGTTASNIAATGGFFYSATKEARKSIASAKNAVVFNIPHCLLLPMVQSTILSACSVIQHPSPCSRLRKKSPKYICLIISQFLYELSAEELITNKSTIANCRLHKNIKIFTNNTPFQRDRAWSQNFITTSEVSNNLVPSSAPR